jgi:hypothetical protein
MAIKFAQEHVTKKTDPVTKVMDVVTKSDKTFVTTRKGRPPKGERAMTGAERVRAYRERKSGDG